MEKLLIGIAGWLWLIGGFSSLITICLLKIIPPELLIQKYIPDINWTDYVQIILFIIIGIGILKLKKWARWLGILAACYYLILYIFFAIEYISVALLDLFFSVSELILLNLPMVKRQFR
jgi:hypothetical protein